MVSGDWIRGSQSMYEYFGYNSGIHRTILSISEMAHWNGILVDAAYVIELGLSMWL